jgi:hypothetical protein
VRKRRAVVLVQVSKPGSWPYLRLVRLIVKIELGRARATSRALGSMAHGCDRSSVAFTTVHRTASTAARGGSAVIK